MELLSSAFEHEGQIPLRYTCDGENGSPPLEFRGIPAEAKSLALIMDDPDVPEYVRKDRMYDHWVLFNMLPDTKGLSEKAKGQGIEGVNTGGKLGYTGPCPPDREHRYFFKLYALDTMLKLPSGATKKEVLDSMEGHILEEAILMGRYKRQSMR